ncbi:hypothetical protein K440DRAFT_618244 [Wilcoxina mikolae CBS 423.85]|nr:hypothetical protein K440DRAFT_618244 [Wilcoxina mikolae CBS 423.85]
MSISSTITTYLTDDLRKRGKGRRERSRGQEGRRERSRGQEGRREGVRGMLKKKAVGGRCQAIPRAPHPSRN